MREGLRTYLDLGFVEESRGGLPEGEAPSEEPSPLESTGARRREPVGHSPAPAPTAARATGGLGRIVLWILGGLLVVFLASVTFFALIPQASPAPAPPPPAPTPPASAPEAVPPKPVSVAALVGVLLGATVAVGTLSALVGLLRKLRNPLYWQLACWMLVVVGIAVRPVVVAASGLPTPGQLLVSVALGLAVLPGLMRWLNRVSPRPGLQHVAVPFSLGFFVDLGQVLATSLHVKLPWIPS